jgi:predicted outer membrane repeat protein
LTSLSVGGRYSSLNSAVSALSVASPTSITVGDLVLGNTTAAPLSTTSNLAIKVFNDLLIWNPVSASSSYLINPSHIDISIEVGNTFNVTNARLLVTNTSLSISAKTIVFERSLSTANFGGAMYLAENSVVSLSATENILFKGNKAFHGGAVYMHQTASLTLSGSTKFESNIASWNGGAAYVYSQHVGVFSTSSFWSNQATNGEGCLVYVSDSCTPFTTSGICGLNLQIANNSGTQVCPYNDELCSTSLPPSSPPTPVESPIASPQQPAFNAPFEAPLDTPFDTPQPESSVCTGTQPSVGIWTCLDGLWTSSESLTTTLLTIPGTTAALVVGNLTVSDLTITGLQSSVSVQNGCVYISGTLKIELSAADLEEISKESGSSRTISVISQDSVCPSLSTVAINAYKTASSCRKVEVSSKPDVVDGSRAILTALFKVNSSRCNTKWIILGCVLGGILVIVLVVALVVTFNDKAKAVVRPFWARKRLLRNEL